jgi:hypothetical protein
VSLLSAACGTSAGEETQNVLAAIARSEDRSRSFTYTDATLDGGQQFTVRGRVQDDFLYAGTVSAGEKELYEMVVSDDAVALRLIDLESTKPIVELARRIDTATGSALSEGHWVIDHSAAPELRAAARQDPAEGADDTEAVAPREVNPVGDDPFFDAAGALSYADRSFRGSFVTRFNPEDLEYNPADDPWRADKERELETGGVRRFDIVQPPLPPRASRGQQQRLPSLAHFRKMVVYLKGDEALEVQEQISLSDRREFRRAEVGRTAQYYLGIRDAAMRGAVADVVRERRMVYRVGGFEDVEVSLPVDAENGLLREVLGDAGLKALFDFHTIGGRAAAALPAVPTPEATPSATGTPPATSATSTPSGTAPAAPSPSPLATGQ